jgi:hypothetical protein
VYDNADAVPVVMAGFETLNPCGRCVAASALITHHDRHIGGVTRGSDWRTFNLSRLRARQWLTPEWRDYYQNFLTDNCATQAGVRQWTDPRTFER